LYTTQPTNQLTVVPQGASILLSWLADAAKVQHVIYRQCLPALIALHQAAEQVVATRLQAAAARQVCAPRNITLSLATGKTSRVQIHFTTHLCSEFCLRKAMSQLRINLQLSKVTFMLLLRR
jgi:hypothetical protein